MLIKTYSLFSTFSVIKSSCKILLVNQRVTMIIRNYIFNFILAFRCKIKHKEIAVIKIIFFVKIGLPNGIFGFLRQSGM